MIFGNRIRQKHKIIQSPLWFIRYPFGTYVLLFAFLLFITQANFSFINHSHGDGQLPHTHANFFEKDIDHSHNHHESSHDHTTSLVLHFDEAPVLEASASLGDFHWHFFYFSITSLVSVEITLLSAFLVSRFKPFQARQAEETDSWSSQARAPPQGATGYTTWMPENWVAILFSFIKRLGSCHVIRKNNIGGNHL